MNKRKSSMAGFQDPQQTTSHTGRKLTKRDDQLEVENKLDDETYEVEAILDQQIKNKSPLYLVQWKGYPQSQNTWERATNLYDSMDQIDEYNILHSETNKKLRSESTPPPSKKQDDHTQNQESEIPIQKGSPQNDSDEYEIEKILDEQKVRGKLHYLIKWKGFPNSDNTWEPLDNIKESKEELQQFFERRKNKSTIQIVSKPSRNRPSSVKNNQEQEVVNRQKLTVQQNPPPDGTFEFDMPREIIDMEQLPNGDIDVTLAWLPRKKFDQPNNSIYDLQTVKEKCPLLLINFYEKHIRFNDGTTSTNKNPQQQPKSPSRPPTTSTVNVQSPQTEAMQEIATKPQTIKVKDQPPSKTQNSMQIIN